MRAVRESLGDQPVASGAAARQRRAARVHPERAADRPQRPVLLRIGPEVQEVPRPLNAPSRKLPTLTLAGIARDLLVLGACAAAGTIIAGRVRGVPDLGAGQRDDSAPADAIVVLGAAQYDGRPSPVFAARLDHAVDLYVAGVADRLVVTGGKQPGDRTTEAAVARSYAIARGVPDGRRSSSRIAAGRPWSRSEPSRRSCAIAASSASSCRTGPTCCASCGSPATRDRGLRLADDDQPDRRDAHRRLARRSTSSGRSPLYFLTGREAAAPAPIAADGLRWTRNRGCDANSSRNLVIPSWPAAFQDLYCRKTPAVPGIAHATPTPRLRAPPINLPHAAERDS